jgi:polysaccharide export outer membrane protein
MMAALARLTGGGAMALAILLSAGCQALQTGAGSATASGEYGAVQVRGQSSFDPPPVAEVPRELAKISLPAYVIEPPDILLIDAVKVVPKPPYRIEPLDILQISVDGTRPDQPIAGLFSVDTGGFVQLGAAYGAVKVIGLTIEEATNVVDKHLRGILARPKVTVSLAQTAAQQQIVGEHLVGPDGRVNLGAYGSVYVTGMTLAEAKVEIEKHLSQHLQDPKIALDVFAYNSKVYYVVLEGAGQGDRVARLPFTGNETVLDALAQMGGTSVLQSKNMWIARPAPGDVECDQVLPVNWQDITRGGSTRTNYQILPGDRVFIAEDRWLALDHKIETMKRPFEQIFGFILLGAQSVQTVQRFPRGFQDGFF